MLLKTGADLFLQIPDGSSERFLHRARLVAISESGYVVDLRANLHLQVEDEILVYFDAESEFVQQQARISALLSDKSDGETPALERSAQESSPQQLVYLETTTDPTSAENRTDYRIRVTSAEVTATLDAEPCDVDDVSATGFAVFSHKLHNRGTILPAAIRYAGQEHAGRVCIRSVREAKSGTRYGVSYVAEPGGRSRLASGLRSISQAIPREHQQPSSED